MTDESNEPITKGEEKKPLVSYFDLSSAVDDVKTEFAIGDVSDKAKSSAKLIGKTLFNVGLFTGKLGWEAAKAAPSFLENHNNEIRELKLKYEGMQDDELIRVVHSDGFLGKTAKEKGVAFNVLRTRGFSVEDINSRND